MALMAFRSKLNSLVSTSYVGEVEKFSPNEIEVTIKNPIRFMEVLTPQGQFQSVPTDDLLFPDEGEIKYSLANMEFYSNVTPESNSTLFKMYQDTLNLKKINDENIKKQEQAKEATNSQIKKDISKPTVIKLNRESKRKLKRKHL